MAMMMTGRVLLVCALCVLWCGVFGIVAYGACGGDADGSAVEYSLLRWRAQLRSECAEEVSRRTGDGANASAVEECVRQGTDGVRAVVDGRGHWRPQQFVVVAAENAEELEHNHESSPQTLTGSVAQLPDQQPLESSPNSVPGSAVITTGEGKPTSSAQPPGTPDKGSEGLIKKESDDEGTKEKSEEEEDEEVEETDEEEDDNAGSGTSDGSQEQGKQKAGTGQRASGGTGKENGNVVAGNKLTEAAAASPPVVSVDVENPKSVELTRDDVGGKRQTHEKTVQEPPAVKLRENVAAEIISTEDAAEGEKQKAEEKAEETETKEEQRTTAEKLKEETPTTPEKTTKEEQKDKEVQHVQSKNEEKETDGAEPTAKKEADVEKTAAFKNINMNNITKPGESDSSTAVSHTTSPLLLLLVACAAAAAVVAA
ncbi:Mucin-associated surface protein (MASP) [Trypanosoma cruzi]|uniref:Mucin-associated surface protein (MASP), putative n=2 Tax=Trypanosoma cruzi TaxID=5693 RepID=Q4D8A5_TRYCC|nr:mucin-associated surface protein (MASP), putative [Trypanosoma cruzi]XP_813875.1 mucin-associated surface protein (MASP), putative [Trypanosoma cruzi]EAN88753.1 mucin-associated surface protein (MASP), putative [Trypanosoma cruzi]EAN92024.1 mucin-associated surface protein (MASP), putative [Trypanosoma cruzi]KAF8303774.1 Mucin-associated surface protein (MASP), subgroup S122 [Trypanosoma cruzi]PWV13026.1 Mucin-associated surface protein (MASP) [Trypanosoma cruzi]PWV13038.1 Mucin-associated|eukprot:XP_810604.1 mucin-associated surface protein (MASP) [Trypanosoma cruzi strain CL Brener]